MQNYDDKHMARLGLEPSNLNVILPSSSTTSRELLSQLIVDEDDFKLVINEKKYCYY